MLKNSLCYFLALFFIVSCNNKSTEDKPLRWLEDIRYNKSLDKSNFKICNGEENVKQYFNLGDNIEIEGDKPYINSHFTNGFNSEKMPKESGLIRIRFIVNCEGQTDRFRLLESDLQYGSKKFNRKISDTVMALSKSLTGWKQKINSEGNPADYYQYLVFRIVNGEIIKILP